ncbi:MAG: hypothetical protein Crog4KO_20900 [Crocinitomicaceae bacterium]
MTRFLIGLLLSTMTASTISSCSISGTAVSENSGTLETTKVVEVSEESKFFSVASTVPVNTLEISGGGIRSGIPLRMYGFGGKLGNLELNVNYPLNLLNFGDLTPIKPVTNDVNRFQGKFIYGVPVFNFFSPKKEVSVKFGEYDNGNYYGTIRSKYLNSVNLRAGAFKDFSINQTYYKTNLITGVDPEDFFNEEIVARQSTMGISFGASFQRLMDLTLEGNGDGKKLKGRETSLLSVYFDVNLMLRSNADQIFIEFMLFEQESGNPTFFYNPRTYELSELLPQRQLGFALGLESLSFEKKKAGFNVTQAFEIGMRPGYFENVGEAWYMRYLIRYGIGGRSKH